MADKTNAGTIWDEAGAILGNAPQWARYRKQLDTEFPTPFKGGTDTLALAMKKAVEMVDSLRP